MTHYHGRLEFHHPDLQAFLPTEILQDDLMPIYPEIEALTSHRIAKLVTLALAELPESELDQEKFPSSLRQKYGLLSTR